MNIKELKKLIAFKIDDERNMTTTREHGEYYRGRQTAFQFILDILDNKNNLTGGDNPLPPGQPD